MATVALFSTAYFPPVQYFKKLKNYSEILIEHHEHFEKQTYRNRCTIYGANGKLNLTIPLNYWKDKTKTKDITICNDENWQQLHRKSIESAYRKSPYFEFYEDEFAAFFSKNKFKFLIELNEAVLNKITALLKMNPEINFTSEYKKEYKNTHDFRTIISPKKKSQGKDFIPYQQTFENKHGFIPNLSILDLIFNQGPRAIDYF